MSAIDICLNPGNEESGCLRAPTCYGKMHPGQDKEYAGKARSGMLWKGDSDETITGKNGK